VLCDAAPAAGERSRRSSSLLLPRMPHAADCRSDQKRHLATGPTVAVIDGPYWLGGGYKGMR